MGKKKIAGTKNVYELAQERLKVIFNEFDNIYVSFSGGKDSGVLLNMCIDYIRKNNLKVRLGVLHMDYEIQYKMTIDYVDRILEANKDILDVYRVCIPFRVATCTSMYQSFWRPWEDSKKNIWVRPMPKKAMTKDDFTFYNNAMSGYAYTEHSLPLILSGEWFENKEPFIDYRNRIFKSSPFFNYLREQGYTLSNYDDEYKFEKGVMDGAFNNITYTKSSLWDRSLFNTRIIKMVGMKYAPYVLKPYCWFNVSMLKNQEMSSKDEELFSWRNDDFYKDVQEDDITYVDGKRFKLIHLMGAHVPFYFDKDVNVIDDADYYTSIESSMTVTMAYLNKLREAGVYDNSVIIILSDHGYNIEGEAVKVAQKNENETGRQHPILFVKGLNESHDLQVSGAPISYEDLVEAYYKLMDGAASDDCFAYKEGDQRERRYLLYKYLGEDHMVEYVQTGYAGDESTLVPTGRVFDAK